MWILSTIYLKCVSTYCISSNTHYDSFSTGDAMPHLTKITLLPLQLTKYVVTTKCANCDTIITVPEPYLTWYMRTFEVDPASITIKCIDCGGPTLNEWKYIPEHWSQCSLAHEEKPLCKVPDTVVEDAKEDWRTSFYGDTSEHTHCTYKYKDIGYHRITYVTFSAVYKELRKFISKEETHEQPGAMEQSLHHRPESDQKGKIGGV